MATKKKPAAAKKAAPAKKVVAAKKIVVKKVAAKKRVARKVVAKKPVAKKAAQKKAVARPSAAEPTAASALVDFNLVTQWVTETDGRLTVTIEGIKFDLDSLVAIGKEVVIVLPAQSSLSPQAISMLRALATFLADAEGSKSVIWISCCTKGG
jgi:hypothetical protein